MRRHFVPPRRLLLAAIGATCLVATCLVATSACGTRHVSASGTLHGASPRPSAGSPTSTPTHTSQPTATHTSHPTAAPTSHAYPSDYPVAILSAAANSDYAYLALLTTSTTADQVLHDLNGRDKHWTLINNDGAMGSTFSSFYNQGGDEIIIKTSNQETSAHHWHAGALQSWDKMFYPNTALDYGKAYVDGWNNGNVVRMRLLGTDALAAYLTTSMTAPGPDYTATVITPGGTEVDITQSPSFDISLIIVDANLGHPHAIGGCDIGC